MARLPTPVADSPPSEAETEELRRRSKLVLGNSDRIEVAAAIARSEDGWVNATDLQFEIGIVQSRIRNQLVALADAGLLDRGPEGAGKLYYGRRPSPFWDLCLALYADWTR